MIPLMIMIIHSSDSKIIHSYDCFNVFNLQMRHTLFLFSLNCGTNALHEAKHSTIDKVKIVEDNHYKFWSDMVCKHGKHFQQSKVAFKVVLRTFR